MKRLFTLAAFFIFMLPPVFSQNQTYNFMNEGIYYPNLNEEWVLVNQDTISGNWIKDTFFSDDNIHSYVFRDSGVETRWNTCLPPTDVAFKTQFGLPYQAEYWSFRSNTNGMYLLGFADVNQKPFISILLNDVRYNPQTGKAIGFQNGKQVIVRNPIDRTAFE